MLKQADLTWKQAAAQESVDYSAVEKTFMDQAYGYVANKAKVLFRDPFRLGFEIVHRNEKATKLVGIFAFRCGHALLYAPVFFVNGEVKGTDMLYRGDVKRFVPLTEDWCSFLVKGANEESGKLVDRGRRRQADAYMDRLAYPQRIKYASLLAGEAEAIKSIGQEMFKHCADDSAPKLLLPQMIDDAGPVTLEKLASMIEGSHIAQRFVVENYTEEQLSGNGWMAKQASAAPTPADPYANCVVLVRDITMAKTAASRDEVANRGYSLEEYREAGAVKHVTENIDDPSIYQLNAPCEAEVMLASGDTLDVVMFIRNHQWLESSGPLGCCSDSSFTYHSVYSLSDGEMIDSIYDRDKAAIFGKKKELVTGLDSKFVKPSSAQTGKTYILVHKESLECSKPFLVTEKDGNAIHLGDRYGFRACTMFYVDGPDTASPHQGYVNDEYALLEVKSKIEKNENRGGSCKYDTFELEWNHALMSNAQLDQWLRTGGKTTESGDITITKEPDGLFSIRGEGFDGPVKVARGLDRLQAHLKLASDWEMRTDVAGKVLDFAEDRDVYRFRLHSPVEKKAYVTRAQGMENWLTGYDPVINVQLDAPQMQLLQTHTPQRMRQHVRYGDTYQNERGKNGPWDSDDGLPEDEIMSQSPEELAGTAQRFGLPHVFDHAVIGRMANSIYDTIEQVRQYIPDLETGVDRHARILFLLRYRPADFEEAYGQDELMEMEQELSSVFQLSGESLLRLLKRFDVDKFRPQVDS